MSGGGRAGRQSRSHVRSSKHRKFRSHLPRCDMKMASRPTKHFGRSARLISCTGIGHIGVGMHPRLRSDSSLSAMSAGGEPRLDKWNGPSGKTRADACISDRQTSASQSSLHDHLEVTTVCGNYDDSQVCGVSNRTLRRHAWLSVALVGAKSWPRPTCSPFAIAWFPDT